MTTNSAASALAGGPAAAPAAASAPAPAGDGGAAAPAAAAPAAAPAGDAWYSGITNQEVRTWTEAKGFKDPLAVAESAYNLEKLIGFDKAGKTIVIPDENSSPETRAAFNAKMGVPADPTGYKLPVPDGMEDTFAKEASTWFHEQGVSAKAAEGLTVKFNEYIAKNQAAVEQAFNVKSEQEFNALKGEWGAAYDQNLELGKRAAAQFIPGTADERAATLASMEQAIGTGMLLKMMASIGGGLGEHKVHADGGGSGVMTPAQANQRIAELKSNKDWTAAYLGGDKTKATELQHLIAMANAGAQ